ncbi:MAG: AAA family ATPase [Bacteroidales bacterium]|nr:AAA family ATPase [Bacteroidales bacterium]
MAEIIGRKKEIEELNRLYHSDKAQFVAVYGRRRVGKTYLINQVFKDRMAFHHTGLSPFDDGQKMSMRHQLQAFHLSLLRSGLDETTPCPSSWLEAFFLLEKLLTKIDTGERQVVFIDELSWMDTPRSGFLTALESFWNGWASARDNMFLVVCGSSTTWMLGNLVNNYGGLYGRLTCEIKLSPFTLKECDDYLKSNGIVLSQYDVVQAYMAFGGIPYYLGYFEPGLSLAQNIDKILFANGAPLLKEYDRLFRSLFVHWEEHQKVVGLLATRHYGFTRDEISKQCDISKGGGLSSILKALIDSNFIIKYTPVATGRKEDYYRLCDPFCAFFLKFAANHANTDPQFWQNSQNLPSIVAWRGFAFEQVCFNHIAQIKAALGVSGVVSRESALLVHGDNDNPGGQIDLLIDRADNVLNLCEMKFYKKPFVLSQQDRFDFEDRVDLLGRITKPKKNIHFTLVTTFGLKHSEHSGVVQKVVTLEDLFRF